MVSTDRNIIIFREVSEKLGNNDQNFIRFSVNIRCDSKDNNMTIPKFRLAKFDKMSQNSSNVKLNKLLDVDTVKKCQVTLKIKYISLRETL